MKFNRLNYLMGSRFVWWDHLNMEKPMESEAFAFHLASISQWKLQGKRAVWIQLRIQLVHVILQIRFLKMLHVGIGAFVVNDKREVLAVQENNGKFKGKGVWKFPTGVVSEGEDICMAAIREVKEETGAKPQVVLHEIGFVFRLHVAPSHFDIQKQDAEIEAAKWMAFKEYAAQAFVQKHDAFSSVADVCLTKLEKEYVGFSLIPRTTASGKTSYLYLNTGDQNKL
ncbi:Nudix hydrolase isoform 2 [Hibiscus syriacus]|uniref:Nudix hydrolase isoform 2 n=1 Tax=Hibiscus syriacus TaxID=106335 RepID=A0A6A2ZDP6_HIBSY|nr:Nudix hydrolase isoform 2 [Hibiscus syriacus]